MQPERFIIECQQYSQSSGFFDIKFTDLISLFSTLASGIFIVLYVSVVFGKRQKRLDIINSRLCSISDDVLRRIMNSFIRATGKALTSSEKDNFTALFKLASNELILIYNISQGEKKYKITDKQLADWSRALIEFKAVVTDKPFRSDYIISVDDETQACEKHHALKSYLLTCSYSLYK